MIQFTAGIWCLYALVIVDFFLTPIIDPFYYDIEIAEIAAEEKL